MKKIVKENIKRGLSKIFAWLEPFPKIQELFFKEKYAILIYAKAYVEEENRKRVQNRHEALMARINQGHNIRIDRKKRIKKMQKVNPIFHKHAGSITDASVFPFEDQMKVHRTRRDYYHGFVSPEGFTMTAKVNFKYIEKFGTIDNEKILKEINS